MHVCELKICQEFATLLGFNRDDILLLLVLEMKPEVTLMAYTNLNMLLQCIKVLGNLFACSGCSN